MRSFGHGMQWLLDTPHIPESSPTYPLSINKVHTETWFGFGTLVCYRLRGQTMFHSLVPYTQKQQPASPCSLPATESLVPGPKHMEKTRPLSFASPPITSIEGPLSWHWAFISTSLLVPWATHHSYPSHHHESQHSLPILQRTSSAPLSPGL